MHIYLMPDTIKEYSRVTAKPSWSKIEQLVISLPRMLHRTQGLVVSILARKIIHAFTHKSIKELFADEQDKQNEF